MNLETIYSNTNPQHLRELVAGHLVPSKNDCEQHAEVSTPVKLVDTMLDHIPDQLWTHKIKVFEPCCGKGNFVLGIFDKLFAGLSLLYPDPVQRCRIIINQCLYYADINQNNVSTTTQLLKYHVNYYSRTPIGDLTIDGFNCYVGNTLQLDINKQWHIDGFHLVIGNPPYHSDLSNRGSSHVLWTYFAQRGIDWLLPDGLLSLVHPSGWRDVSGGYKHIQRLLTSNKILYLQMNDFKTGHKYFGMGTNFDFYVVQKTQTQTQTQTHVIDIDGKHWSIDVTGWQFIPSGCFNQLTQLLAQPSQEKVNVIYSASLYHITKKWMSAQLDDTHIHPCCYSITRKSGLTVRYSSVQHGHFGIPKVIWSNGLGTYPIIDQQGQYGLTQFSYCIADHIENLKFIADALNHTKFIGLMNYVKFTNNKYNYKVIGLLRRDFWKDFIEAPGP